MQRRRLSHGTPPRKQAFRVVPPIADVRTVDPDLREFLRSEKLAISRAADRAPIDARVAHHLRTSLATVSAPEMSIRWNRDEKSRTRALLLFVRVGGLAVSGQGPVVRRAGTAALIPPGDTPVEIATTHPRNEFVYISCDAHVVPASMLSLVTDVEAPPLPWRTFAPLYAFVQAASATQPLRAGEPDMLTVCTDVIVDSGVQAILSGVPETVDVVGQVRALISEHHTDPDVTPSSIAGQLRVPPRTLQAAFAAENSTLRDELRAARTQTAMMLRETHPQLSQAHRARLSGFASLSAMYRALQTDAPEIGDGLHTSAPALAGHRV